MTKWTIIAASLVLLGACTNEQMALWVPESDKTPMTTNAKLKACTLDEARNKVMDGSAFTLGMSAAANEISTTCVKKLALESAGLDTQATQDSYNALQSLMGTAKSIAGQ